MIAVAVLAGLILIGTVLYLAWPLRRAADAGSRERHHQLIQQRDRLLAQLNELDVEEGDRNMEPAIAADERARLEAELAGVLRELDRLQTAGDRPAGDSTAPAAPALRRLWYGALAAFFVLLPGIAGGLYLMHFTPPPADPFEIVAPDRVTPQQILDMVARLERRLAESPDDARGWARLGRSYAVLGREKDAEQAYSKAYQLAPEDSQIVAEFAWLLYQRDPGYTGEPVRSLYARLNRLEPDNPEALWFLGLAAYQKQDLRVALGYWERLHKTLPPDSPTAKDLETVIARARQEMASR